MAVAALQAINVATARERDVVGGLAVGADEQVVRLGMRLVAVDLRSVVSR
jgi:hypothetical protein